MGELLKFDAAILLPATASYNLVRDCDNPSVYLADAEFWGHPAKYEHTSTFGGAA